MEFIFYKKKSVEKVGRLGDTFLFENIGSGENFVIREKPHI